MRLRFTPMAESQVSDVAGRLEGASLPLFAPSLIGKYTLGAREDL